MQLKRLFINVSALAGGGVVAQISLVTAEAIIARLLGQSGYGIYATVTALALPVAVFADIGMSWKLIQDGSRDRRAIAPLLGTTMLLKSAVFFVVYPVSLFSIGMVGYGPDVVVLYAIFFGYSAMTIMQESLAAAYAAQQRMYVTAVFQSATQVVILVCLVSAFSFSAGLSAVGWSFLIGSTLVTFGWACMAYFELRPVVRLRSAGEILRGSYLYGIGNLLWILNPRIEVILLSVFRDLSEVGLFAAGDKLVGVFTKLGTLFSRVLAPMLFEQSHHDPEAYRRSCKVTLRLASAAGAFVCLALAMVAEPVLVLIFGASFSAAAVAMVLLTMSLAARLIAVVLQVILSASEAHMHRTGSLVIALIGSVSANLILIPRAGIVGAAIGRAIADGIYLGAMLVTPSLPLRRRSACACVFGPLLIAFFAYLATRALPIGAVFRMPVALAFYLTGLSVTRIVRPVEVRQAIAAIRVSR